MYLIGNVNHTTREIVSPGGNLITVNTGQVWVSQRKLAGKLGISRQSLRTAIDFLEKTQFLTHKPAHRGTIITLLFPHTCEDVEPRVNPPPNPRANPQPTQCQPRLKNVKKDKNNIYTPEFSKFLEVYPKAKRGRTSNPAAFRQWKARLNEGKLAANMIRGAQGYAKVSTDPEHTKGAQVFIGRDLYFEGYLVEEQPKESYYAGVEREQARKKKNKEGKEMIQITPEMRKELFPDDDSDTHK